MEGDLLLDNFLEANTLASGYTQHIDASIQRTEVERMIYLCIRHHHTTSGVKHLDVGDAVGRRLTCHGQRHGHVCGAVVDSRQHMAVQVDHGSLFPGGLRIGFAAGG